MSQQAAGFHVKYEVKETETKGLGIVLTEPVARGTLLWRGVDGENVLFLHGKHEVREHIKTLETEESRIYFAVHMYHENGHLNYDYDDARFWNHSKEPNTGGSDPMMAYALRDITAGEELTEDYEIYEYPAWFVDLCYEYNVDMDYFKIPDQYKEANIVQHQYKEANMIKQR